MKQEDKERLPLYLEPDLKAKVKEAANKDDRNMNSWIVKLLRDHFNYTQKD